MEKLQNNKQTNKNQTKSQSNQQFPQQNEGFISKTQLRKAQGMLRTMRLRRENGIPVENEEAEQLKCQAVIDQYNEYNKLNEKATLSPNNNLSVSKADTVASLDNHLKVSRTNKDSDKVQPMKRKKRRVPESLQKYKISMALANDIDGLIKPVARSDWPMIENEISETLLIHLLKSRSRIPRYQSRQMYRGFIIISSKDQFSKDFLLRCVAQVRNKFNGMSLTLIPTNQIPTILRNRSSCDTSKYAMSPHKPNMHEGLNDANFVAEKHREKYLTSQLFLQQMENVKELTSSQSKHIKKAHKIIRKYEKLHDINSAKNPPPKPILKANQFGNSSRNQYDLVRAQKPTLKANQFGNSSRNQYDFVRAQKPTNFANQNLNNTWKQDYDPEPEIYNEVRSNRFRDSHLSTPGYSTNQPNSYFQSDMQRMPKFPSFPSNWVTRGTLDLSNQTPRYSSAVVRRNTINERSQLFSNSRSFMRPGLQANSEQASHFQTYRNHNSKAENFHAGRSTLGSNYHRTEFPYGSNRKY